MVPITFNLEKNKELFSFIFLLVFSNTLFRFMKGFLFYNLILTIIMFLYLDEYLKKFKNTYLRILDTKKNIFNFILFIRFLEFKNYIKAFNIFYQHNINIVAPIFCIYSLSLKYLFIPSWCVYLQLNSRCYYMLLTCIILSNYIKYILLIQDLSNYLILNKKYLKVLDFIEVRDSEILEFITKKIYYKRK